MNRVLQGPSDILSLCKLNHLDQVAVIGKRGKGHPVTDNNNPYSTPYFACISVTGFNPSYLVVKGTSRAVDECAPVRLPTDRMEYGIGNLGIWDRDCYYFE